MYAEVMTEHRGVRDVNIQLPIVILTSTTRWRPNSLCISLFYYSRIITLTYTQKSLQRRALSEVLPEGGRSSRRREEARQVEFVRVGQALKLDTIVKGDAPTSLASTGLFRRSVRRIIFFYFYKK